MIYEYGCTEWSLFSCPLWSLFGLQINRLHWELHMGLLKIIQTEVQSGSTGLGGYGALCKTLMTIWALLGHAGTIRVKFTSLFRQKGWQKYMQSIQDNSVFPILNLKIHLIQLIRWQKWKIQKKTFVRFELLPTDYQSDIITIILKSQFKRKTQKSFRYPLI